MTAEQIVGLVRDATLSVIFAVLWFLERGERMLSQQRERDLLLSGKMKRDREDGEDTAS
jgi:hypothetical protein